MNISLDYDDTFTRDPAAWKLFIATMRGRGHKVYIVTWRDEGETLEVEAALRSRSIITDGIYATNRKGKEKFMYAHGIRIDVWIDDTPHAIIRDMEVL